ncbi:MAG: hypothetical protein DMF94_25760 [Acidobacteria bacterium]|nr:MAG: hypothetical protein DMF96_02395 [Acidobacteriota bacterium]PYR16973.1 MAG: hypothetical protein DMF94_25760 [Acidobacteriota bacterium]
MKNGREDFLMKVGSRILFASVLTAGFLARATPVVAHHSAAAAYDETKRVEAQGTVTKVLVRNPHSWVFLESADDKGQKIEWQIEMGGVPSMAWAKDALPIGAAVKVAGNPSRAPGSHGITGATFTKADGTPVGPRGGRGEYTPR